MLLILSLEIVKDITYAKTRAAYLVSIGRTDALTGGTHLVLTLRSLDGSVKHTMSRHDEMSLLGDVQATLQVVTALLQVLSLLHEEVWSQDDTVTNNVHLSTLEDTRRDRAKNVLLPLKLQGMACVRTALETSYDIILRGQHVNHLTFTFIAPLKTQQDIYFTCVHFLSSYFDFSILSVLRFRVILAWQALHTP